MRDRTRLIMARITVPALLTGALAASVIWGVGYKAEALTFENSLTALYEKCLIEAAGSITVAETALRKLTVTSSPEQSAQLLSEVWRETGVAETVLSQLPASHEDFSPLIGFLARCGDFARQLQRSVDYGKPVSAEDSAQLKALYAACQGVAEQIYEYVASGQTGASFHESTDFYTGASAMSFKQTEGEERYPHLIYDGPFSESTMKAEPLGLPKETVDKNEANQAAANFMGELAQGGLRAAAESNGRIPAFGFSGETASERSFEVYVTKQGGQILWMRSVENAAKMVTLSPPPQGNQAKNDAERAKKLEKLGLQFLEERGYSSMQSTYAQHYDGETLINYAYLQNGTICYNDLVKVWLNDETGEVTGFDATNYLFSHVKRDIPPPAISAAQASERVSDELEVVQIRRALIPVTPQAEKLCYEFKAKRGAESYVVYINASTGLEEQLYLIIDSENGELVL